MTIPWWGYVVLAGLAWGTYVPIIFYGGSEFGGKPNARLMAILCVGVAYFVLAVLFPMFLFLSGQEKWPTMATTGLVFSSLAGVAGAVGATEGDVTMAGEDFSRFSAIAPGFFFNLGVTPPHLDPKTVASNHSPLFQGDDRALAVGVRAMTNMAMDFLRSGGVPKLIP